jgi:uncharacterized protein (DUF111 family)
MPLYLNGQETSLNMLILVNVDDISGELLPHVIDGLLARGAANVHAIQSITKKGRLAYVLFVDAPDERLDDLAGFLVSEVGTIGIRVLESRHIRFDYRIRNVRLTVRENERTLEAQVRVKEVYNGDQQVVSVKAEYEDLRLALAQFEKAGVRISLAALKRLVEQNATGQGNGSQGDIHIEAARDVSLGRYQDEEGLGSA